MMKKISLLACGLALIAGLSACNDEGSSLQAPGAPSTVYPDGTNPDGDKDPAKTLALESDSPLV